MVFRLLLVFLLTQELVAAQISVAAQVPVVVQDPVIAQRPNLLDSLQTNEQILSFIRGLNQSRWPAATFYPSQSPDKRINGYRQDYQRRLDSFGAKPYEKLDLDNNGLTDLLFNGYDSTNHGRTSLLVLAFEKDSFQVIELPKEEYKLFFAAKIIRAGGYQQLQTLTECYAKRITDAMHETVYIQTRVDTLTWQYPDLTEATHTGWHKIDTLRYMLQGGLGGRSLQLTIIGDSVTLEKECELWPQTPIDSGGIFTAKMNFVTSGHLYTLLNAISFEHLNKAYEAPGSDQSTSDFEICYDQGKRKTIYDYGMVGTYGLSTLANVLLTFPKTLHWKRIAPGGRDYFFIQDFYEFPF